MRILVLQHSPLDHPGLMRRYMAEDGIAWDAIDVYAGQNIPSLNSYDAMVVMGGPQQTDQEAAHPWLAGEKEYIRRAVLDGRKPVMGVCLGGQLIAEAMGGRVGALERPEIGILDIETTNGAAGDALFTGISVPAKTLQWHLYAILDLPPGAAHLMRSPACENQAFRVGERAWGMQFHMEMSVDMVLGVEAYPEYVAALEAQHGAGALTRLAEETARNAGELDRSSRLIFDNFVSLA
ncbi:MAG: type 1 glutamine amidotransferase [Alphaproteobacteria bacterium]|jgi:GMP synthase-like glutamine amidotransferase|nr:type 1 glutamine amidotransferase [Alphaproteobacteria bacterium]MDP6587993.1 type 1 glutamine amidotransferase [Alphaproteobacteria bacterium]MDP6819559.1 type 1 glutamine amidotransferase [Alphaproteobacteria bacterium]